MKRKIFAVAAFAFAFAFAFSAAAVDATSIYSSSTGYLMVGSGMGAKAYQAPNVVAAQTALNACQNSALVLDGKFGPLTKGVFVAFQASQGIAQDGIIGPVTAGKLAACSGSTTPTPGNSGSLGGGEASLEQFDLSSEDDAEEGAEKHVATIEFDVEDGDIMINRIDVSFTSTSVSGTADTDPWDVFETLTLMVDGDEVASESIDDEDDWLDDDGTTTAFRLSGLDFVVEKGDTAEIEIYLEAQGSVDDAANADWIIFVGTDAVRGTDGEGLTQEIGDASDTVAFGVDEVGGDESIEIKSSSNDPDATTLFVETDTESEWYEIMMFKLEAEESDIELDTLDITVTTGTEDYEDVIDDIKIEINGTEVDDVTVTDGDTITADLEFDIDKEITIDADETEEVTVWAKFKQADGTNYATTGETVQVTVTRVDGEGADDVFDTATLNGSEHELSTAGAEVSSMSWTLSGGGAASGSLDFFFTVEAVEGDIDVTDDAFDAVDTLTSTGSASIAAAVVTKVSGDASGTTDAYTVAEGDEARFRVRYAVTGSAGSAEVTVTEAVGYPVPDDEQLSDTMYLE